MPINKAVLAAFKAATRLRPDIREFYKTQRLAEDVSAKLVLPNPRCRIDEAFATMPDGFEVPLRVFTPLDFDFSLAEGLKVSEDSRGTVLFFHGGGWVLGGIGSCARFCAELAAAGHVLVLAADYRLAPEHPFPQGLDDCMRAVETALRRASEWGGSPERVSVGGDSSGGNLALAVALRRRAEGLPPLRSLVLFYPVVTARADGSASWKRYGQGAALDGTLMETFSLAYASGREEFPLVSPAAASDAELAGLPPLLLVAAGRDILRDQGEAFAERLLRLGVAVRREELAGAVHLFVTVPGQERAFRRAVALAREFLAG